MVPNSLGDFNGRQGRSASYLRLLLLLLLTASFFDGYDGGILDTVPTAIQDTFQLTVSGLAIMRFFIKSGAVVAFFVAQSADRFGRRPILLWSVVGYTIATGATAFAPNVVTFTIFQFIAQIFLAAEYAVAVTIIVEEFSTERRGRALGTFALVFSAGVVLVPILALTPLNDTRMEWRALYLVGLVPLALTALLRRRIKETSLFQAQTARKVAYAEAAATGNLAPGEHAPAAHHFWTPWRKQYRYYMIVLALVTFFRSMPVYGGVAWWVWFAQREVGLRESTVLLFLIVAFGLGITGYSACGHLMDRYGRKPVSIAFGLLAWVSATILFQVHNVVVQALFVALTVFFGLGITPALNAFYTELFPTEIRATAAAWARNAFEIPGVLFGPLIIGLLGDHGSGAIGSVGNATIIFGACLPVMSFLIWRYLPETKGRDLAALDARMALG